jgi:hypothetical protein
MHRPKRLAAGIAAAATLAAVVPATGSAAITPVFPTGQNNSQICLSGVYDPGPFGPMGPYGPLGPYGKDGPLNGQPNPLGDVASCGGLFTYILRGGNVSSFVQANLHPGGH